jgi:hypothetical protein
VGQSEQNSGISVDFIAKQREIRGFQAQKSRQPAGWRLPEILKKLRASS